MSLEETLRAGVETAFSVGSEFVTVGRYLRRVGEGVYDPTTDTSSPGAELIDNVRFLKTSSNVTEREASPVAITDVKFLIPRVDLDDVDPGENDQLEPGDGVTYNVVAYRFVPGKAIVIVFGRRA